MKQPRRESQQPRDDEHVAPLAAQVGCGVNEDVEDGTALEDISELETTELDGSADEELGAGVEEGISLDADAEIVIVVEENRETEKPVEELAGAEELRTELDIVLAFEDDGFPSHCPNPCWQPSPQYDLVRPQ